MINYFQRFKEMPYFKIFLFLAFLFVLYFFLKKVVLYYLTKIVDKSKNSWDDEFLNNNVFSPVIMIVPFSFLYFNSNMFMHYSLIVQKFSLFFIVFLSYYLINNVINSLVAIYSHYKISKKRPIRGYAQGIKIVLFIFMFVFAVSIILDKSPWGIISSIGALTAILMLVFKDTILSFVAGIQITFSNIMQEGDWIEIPKYGVDGEVVEIALHQVKIQNWDKTISNIPTHKFLDESFKNWRGMSESGGRRLKKHIFIDAKSIRFLNNNDIKKFKEVGLLSEYIDKKSPEIDSHNKKLEMNLDIHINGRRLTNIGIFRKYLEHYLQKNEFIRNDMTLMVRQLQHTEKGLPIELYCFTNTTVWKDYEEISSDIFDHIFAVANEFDLKIFQFPTELR